jgi:hypothetical protein
MAERLSHAITVLQATASPGYEYILDREKQDAVNSGQAALDHFFSKKETP